MGVNTTSPILPPDGLQYIGDADSDGLGDGTQVAVPKTSVPC